MKYGKLPTKFIITVLWEALCVDHIGPDTLKGKDGTQIDFMCLTMIDPASSWFKIVELPVVEIAPATCLCEKEKDMNITQLSRIL